MRDILRKIIREQIEVFFESFEMKNEKESYVPTNEVAKIAQTALEAIEIAKQNGIQPSSLDRTGDEGSGRVKARQLSQKEKQGFVEMKRLKAFFEKNWPKVEVERKKLGIIQQRRGTISEMSKSNILLVWNLHGGDACKEWIDLKLSDTHHQGIKTKERLRKVGGAYKNNGMGVFRTQYDPSQQRIHR